jgi:peptidoglycan/xylan/chitin deacetylase (PgdA/CDA1 family)
MWKRWLGGILVLALALLGLWKLSNSRTIQVFGSLIDHAPCSQKLVALTIDDGPTSEATAPLLRLLARLDVHATFFLIGRELERAPDLGRSIAAAGHQLGNHSYSHVRLLLRSPAFLRHEVEATDQAIRATGYPGEIPFRPPYGKKLFGLPWLLKQTQRTTVMWNLEPDSAAGVGPRVEDRAAYVRTHVTPGSIVLVHAMTDPTGFERRLLEQIIPDLRALGYRWVTLAELRAQCAP